MQQICYLLNIHQSLIPVYHLQANPVERKNRDLKPRLAILVQDKYDCWSEKLPFIRFALNTAKCETTGHTAAFLNFGRELRTPSEVVNDIRVIIQNDNFVPEITPYLKKFAKFSTQIREVVEEQQDSRKIYAHKKRKAAPTYQHGEHVFVASHPLSNAAQGRSAKLMPRRDGSYVISTQRSPSSYEIASLDNPGEPLVVYHSSALTPCNNDKVNPLIPLRKRGRPPKVPQTPGSSSGCRRNQRGRIWSINEYQAYLETFNTGDLASTDHLIRTSAHAPQRPMVTYTEMGTAGPALMGCCATEFEFDTDNICYYEYSNFQNQSHCVKRITPLTRGLLYLLIDVYFSIDVPLCVGTS
ncbi:integrase catalytic domain-containing protein [Trichonephila clavipes]|uniref:Integrase catalytic domain-containing protein n=1 Tax=Trichonephila clavipes TaxID=2585209 RepID=A0A8X6W838_TRICX|nr:integrase catalytic domain-containing protein [Trichonephila clavipes]